MGGDAAVVQDHDLVGEPVGLLEVLGGEDDRGAGGGQVADHVPHGLAGGRVEPGGRLVEEQHARGGDQAGRQVDAAARPAGELADPSACGLVQVEPVDEVAGPAAGGAAQAGEAPDQLEVLRGGEEVVEPGVLPGDPDAGRTRAGWATTSMPSTRTRPASGRTWVVSTRTKVVLPAPLWPSTPRVCPGATVRLTSSRASGPPEGDPEAVDEDRVVGRHHASPATDGAPQHGTAAAESPAQHALSVPSSTTLVSSSARTV